MSKQWFWDVMKLCTGNAQRCGPLDHWAWPISHGLPGGIASTTGSVTDARGGTLKSKEPHTRRREARVLDTAYGVRAAPCAIHRFSITPVAGRIRNTASLQTGGGAGTAVPWKSAFPCVLSGTEPVSNRLGPVEVPKGSHAGVGTALPQQ